VQPVKCKKGPQPLTVLTKQRRNYYEFLNYKHTIFLSLQAVVEALEERIFILQRQLKEKETAYERLKAAHSVEISAKLRLAGFVQECTKSCPSCKERLSTLGQIVQ